MKMYKVILCESISDCSYFEGFSLAINFAKRSVESGSSDEAIVIDRMNNKILHWFRKEKTNE